MVKLSNWITEKSTGKVTLVALVLFIAFTATVLPAQAKKAEIYAAEVGLIDLSLWYTPEDIYEMAEAYGDDGREAFIQSWLSFDVIWPIVYMVFLSTSISYIIKKVFAPGSRIYLLNVVPFLGLVLDYFENISASWIMYKFPIRISFLSNLVPIFTLTKWILIFLSMLILFYGLGAWARLSFHKNRSN